MILTVILVQFLTKENLDDKLPEVEQVFKGDLSSNFTDYNNTRGGSREIKEIEK